MPNTGSLESGGIELGKRVDVSAVPFPTDRVLHWLPKFRDEEWPGPAPIPTLISQEVLTAINSHVSQSLDREIGGFLLGERCKDPNTGQEYVRINQYVEAQATEASSVSLTFTPESWHLLDEEMSDKYSGKLLLGWYHSHPRMNVFLSGYDLQIHRDRFADPWKVALVIEPQKRHGGFFYWRNSQIDPFKYGDFYEFLPVDSVKTRESVVTWVNYVCRDIATGEYFEPLRKTVSTFPPPEVFVPDSPPKSRTNLLIAAMALVVLLAGGLAYYFTRPTGGPGSPVPPVPADPASGPQLPTEVFALLKKIDKDKVRLERLKRLEVKEVKKGKKKVKQTSFVPSDALRLTFQVNDIQIKSAEAIEILKKYLVAQIEDETASVEVSPQGSGLEMEMNAQVTKFLKHLDDSTEAEYRLRLTFKDNRAPDSPYVMKYPINSDQAAKLRMAQGPIIGPVETESEPGSKANTPLKAPPIDESQTIPTTPVSGPKPVDNLTIDPSHTENPVNPKTEGPNKRDEPTTTPTASGRNETEVTPKSNPDPPHRADPPAPPPKSLRDMNDDELAEVRKNQPNRIDAEITSLERQIGSLKNDVKAKEAERKSLDEQKNGKPKEVKNRLEDQRKILKNAIDDLKDREDDMKQQINRLKGKKGLFKKLFG